jgi:hypothetical protein
MDVAALGKIVLGFGAVLVVVGLLMVAVGKGIAPHLPGDLSFRLGSAQVSIPLATSIIISIALTIILNLLARR